MLRNLRRAGLVVLALIALALVGLFVYARFVLGAVVNVPVSSLLADRFPALFAPTQKDVAELAASVQLPPGLRMTVFARGLSDARMLRTTRSGELLLAAPGKGAIWLLQADHNNDGAADGVRLLMQGLDGPNGLDFHDGFLYVAEEGRVGRIGFDHVRGRVTGTYQVVIDNLPRGGNHWKKTIRFGPDGMLYLAIGSSCNACIETDDRRAAMWRYAPDGTGGTRIATGLRNSAGFDWRPSDGALFATDNGRDLLGDDFPACELNQLQPGGFYGWPFVNSSLHGGKGIPDPDMGAGHAAEIAKAQPPAFNFGAHNAPIGILFPTRNALPAVFRNSALVALHGSWNRSKKDGYKVVSLHWGADGSVQARDFVTGFLVDDKVRGRPAELAEGLDGAIYVSDDMQGAVYRIAASATGGSAAAAVPPEPDAAMLALVIAAQQREGAPTVAPTLSTSAEADAGPAQVSASTPVATAFTSEQLREQGAKLFSGSGCLECHIAPGGAAPAAGPAKVALKLLRARYDVQTLQAYLERPRPPMPPVMVPSERAALATWLLEAAP